MIDTHELKKRDRYLNKLIAFQDTEPVKVVTGIRRCGKSSILKLMILHLKESGIKDDQILAMNFESYAFKNMSSDDFYGYVREQIKGCICSLMKSSAFRIGRMRLILFGLILIAISMLQAQTHICFLRNMLLTCLADV